MSFSNASVSSNVNFSGIEAIQVDGGVSNDTLNYSAPGIPVIFNGGTPLVNVDTLNVNSGTFTFNADAVIGTPNLNVNIAPGAAAVFNATQHLYSLNVNGTASLAGGGNKVLVTRTLSVSGKLDLADNKMIINYSVLLRSHRSSATSPVAEMAARGTGWGFKAVPPVHRG